MEPAALVKAASEDPSNEGDIIFRLCEKIREQSQQIADLQKKCAAYESEPRDSRVKELERKLADLTRPIPLSDSLSFPPPSVSLSLSQLMELYSLMYVRMNEVLKEKEELQTNLQEEIMFSEEQSMILENLREEMDKGQDAPSEALQDQLRAKAEALAEAYAEIAKLEEEKNALLEYVEQQAVREEQTQRELSRLQSELQQSDHRIQRSDTQEELSSLRSAYEKTMLEMEDLEEQNQALQQVLGKSKELIATQEMEVKRLEDSEQQLLNLSEKHAETLRELAELREFREIEAEAQLSVLQDEHTQELQHENAALRQQVSQLQKDQVSKPPCVDKSTDAPSFLQTAALCKQQLDALSATFAVFFGTLDRE